MVPFLGNSGANTGYPRDERFFLYHLCMRVFAENRVVLHDIKLAVVLHDIKLICSAGTSFDLKPVRRSTRPKNCLLSFKTENRNKILFPFPYEAEAF